MYRKFLEKLINLNWFWAAIAGCLSLVVYVITLAPTVYIDDSGEFIAAAVNWGIPHPSGYPLWVILGNIFNWLPFDGAAWKINLMTAIISAANIFLLCLLINKVWSFLSKKETSVYLKMIFALGGLFLAFSKIYWNESNSAEVYGLNSFFLVVIIYILLQWMENRKSKYLMWASFLFGLSLTNHQMMALALPGFITFIFLVDRKIFKQGSLLLKSFLLFCLGLTIYLYLPIAAHFKPVINWGDPETWHNFWNHIMRKQYGDLGPFKLMTDKIRFLGSFFILLKETFYWPTLILIIGGVYVAFKKNFKIGWLLLLIFLSNNIFIYLLRSARYGAMNDYYSATYYTPSLVVGIIWLAIFFATMLEFLEKWLKKPANILIIKVATMVVCFLLPLTMLKNNWSFNDKSNFWLSYDYVKTMLQDLEPKAILIYDGYESVADDSEFMGLLYMQFVEKFRSDVQIITSLNVVPENKIDLDKNFYSLPIIERRQALIKEGARRAARERRPLYTTFMVNQSINSGGMVSRSIGNVYRVFTSLTEAKKYSISGQTPHLRNLDDFDVNDLSMADLVSRYYYRLAAYYLDLGDREQTKDNLLRAINLGAAQESYYYRDFVEHRIEWQ